MSNEFKNNGVALSDEELSQVAGGVMTGNGDNVCRINQLQCVHCGACVDVCPVQCIHGDGDTYHIDEDDCIGCEECRYVCVANAIDF